MGGPHGTLEERFWPKVWKSGEHDCWIWTGSFSGGHPPYLGYGTIGSSDKKTLFAHRVAWELLVGPIPEGMTVDHLCGVSLCVNPEHLELVSRRENILRGDSFSARNAKKTHCPRGHPYDEINTRWGLSRGKPVRYCRACRK